MFDNSLKLSHGVNLSHGKINIMIGKEISHYRILEKLGGGGMGVVYKAEDTKLKRHVALKFLPPNLTMDEEAKERFMHEAQAASALDHNNICTIHEIGESEDGQMYLAIALYEGETLLDKIEKGPLPLEEALNITAQISEGLAKAHEKEIVHRDIKPANIMITSDGVAKILDFGLAKLSGRTKLTKQDTTLGTVAYMSPEQVRGEAVDKLTDIWALGVILYEMIAGVSPFKGDYEQAIMYSITNDTPEPITGLRTGVPMEFERILTKSLAKNPKERFQNVGDILVDLQGLMRVFESGKTKPTVAEIGSTIQKQRVWYVAAAFLLVILIVGGFYLFSGHFFTSQSNTISSLAVLPLANLSGDPEQEYFVEGMHEMLITDLSKIGALKVISRTSVMRYKKTDNSIAEIARELNVDALIEGSVLRVGNQVRITAQLIRGTTDEHLWAESYDRDLQNVLAMLSEVAQAIASEIKVVLTKQEEERLAITSPVNPEAQEAYLKARYHYNKWTKEGFEKSIEYFQKAIEIDPNNAQAYTGLAGTYLWLWYLGDLTQEETYPKSKAFVKKALEIDNKLAEGHLIRAMVRFYYEWDWLGAGSEYKQTIDLNPSLVEAHIEYAWALMAMGHFTEAIVEANHSLHLDPLSVPANLTLGSVYFYAHQYDQAIAQWQKTAELEPNDSRAHDDLAIIYEQMGMYDDAVKARQKVMSLSGAKPEEIAALGRIYDQSGYQGYLVWRLEGLKRTNFPYSTASIYARLGDKDQALTLLEKAYKEHAGPMFLLKVHPKWDPLRSEPRFQDLLRRMNFPE
jgi:serine/threonine-protein kinase